MKLIQCNKTAQFDAYNLLPISQWGLATLQSVQLFYSSLLGYYFYGTGVLLPDMTIYDYIMFNPTKFSLLFWIQYDRPGTIAYIINESEGFLFQLRVNNTGLNVTYSTSIRPSQSLTWSWTPTEDWMHVAVILENQHIRVCIDGIVCSTQALTFISTPAPSFAGLKAYIGAVPGQNALSYQDRYTGALNSMGLISNHAVSIDTLNCIIACSERIVIDMPNTLIGGPLSALNSVNSTGVISANGSLQVAGEFRQNEVQEILRHVAYINSHPYPLPGVRLTSYTVC